MNCCEVVDALFDSLCVDPSSTKKLFVAVERKNFGEIRELVEKGALPEAAMGLAEALLTEYKTPNGMRIRRKQMFWHCLQYGFYSYCNL